MKIWIEKQTQIFDVIIEGCASFDFHELRMKLYDEYPGLVSIISWCWMPCLQLRFEIKWIDLRTTQNTIAGIQKYIEEYLGAK